MIFFIDSIYMKLIAQLEFILHLLILFYNFKLLYSPQHSYKQAALSLIFLINLTLLINDFSYYLIVYQDQFVLMYTKTIIFSIDAAVSLLWMIFSTILLCIVLRQLLVTQALKKYELFASILFGTVIVFGCFIKSVHQYSLAMDSWKLWLGITYVYIRILIISMAIICMLYIRSTAMFWYLLGLITLVCGELLISYNELNTQFHLHKQQFDFFGELFWGLGLLIMLIGMYKMSRSKSLNFNQFFGYSKTVKNIIKLKLFYSMMLGFTALLLIGYYLQLISDFAFIWAPLFIVLWAIMAIYVAAQLSVTFNKPFKQIQASVNAILNSREADVNDTFNIKEFQVLHNYLIHSVRVKEERDRIKNEFGILAAEVVHDLNSPLMELDFVVDKIRKNNLNKEFASDVNNVDRLIKEIKSISASILTNYYQLTDNTNQIHIRKVSADDGNLPRFLNLPNLLEGLIESKKFEWLGSNCNINLKVEGDFRHKLIYIAPTKILRALSNLLNNSYQSLYGKAGDINIYLKYVNDEYFAIIIEDSGCGISKEKIYNVLNGHSSKHSGKGIGIPSAVSYLKTINGNLSIESKFNQGTRIIITIPLAPQPKWFDETIRFNKNTIFVVLDDDHNMILLWQKIFSKIGVQSVYFLDNQQLQAWYKDNKENEIIILSDYDLKGELTGLEIISNMSVMQAYLVTRHAEEQWLQEKIEQTNIKLIPKYMIHDIKIVRL